MNKELIIKALNKAIQAYAKNGGKICNTDIVTDFFPDRMYVATLMERHPGALILPVKLQKGSGKLFIGWVTIHCNIIPRIAWEVDNELHSMHSLLGDRGEGYLEAREAHKEIAAIINEFLKKYPYNR